MIDSSIVRRMQAKRAEKMLGMKLTRRTQTVLLLSGKGESK